MAKFSRTVGSSWQKTETLRSGKTVCFIHSHQLNMFHFFGSVHRDSNSLQLSFLVYQFIVWTFTVVVSHYFLGSPRYGDIDVPNSQVAKESHFGRIKATFVPDRQVCSWSLETVLYIVFLHWIPTFRWFENLLFLAKWEASWQFQMLHECFMNVSWMFYDPLNNPTYLLLVFGPSHQIEGAGGPRGSRSRRPWRRSRRARRRDGSAPWPRMWPCGGFLSHGGAPKSSKSSISRWIFQ